MSETPSCGWCSEPSVTEVVVVPGRKKRKTAPACEQHASDFEARGVLTTRVEVDKMMRRERERSQWWRKSNR